MTQISFIIENQIEKSIGGERTTPETNVFGNNYRSSSFNLIFKSSILTYTGFDTIEFQIHSFKDINEEGAKSIGNLYNEHGAASINLPTDVYLELISEIEKNLAIRNEIHISINIDSDNLQLKDDKIIMDPNGEYAINNFSISIKT